MIPDPGWTRAANGGYPWTMGRGAWIACVCLCACGDPEPPPHLWADGAQVWLDSSMTDLPRFETSALPDRGADAGCDLGTVAHCASCGNACPGPDSTSTARACVAGQCAILCKGEHYDVNGSATDGCEVQDDLPLHDGKTSAKDLGSVSDCDSNKKTGSGVLPSDGRKHVAAPTDRPNGRADWFKLAIDDTPVCFLIPSVKVSFAALPSGATYRAKAYYACDKGLELPADTLSASGGSSVTLAPSTNCTTIGDDSGTVYVEIYKESGPASGATYSVEITP